MLADGNTIVARQREVSNLALLAATKKIYGQSKFAASVKLAIESALVVWGIAAGVVPGLAANATGEPTVWAFLLACLIFLLVATDPLLEWRSERKRTTGASTSEQFDCVVFGLPPSSALQLTSTPEDVAYAVGRSGVAATAARDWYRPEIEGLPPLPAILICQRANFYWDSRLRDTYVWLILGLMLASFLLIFGYAFFVPTSASRFLVTVLLPALPLVQTLGRSARSHWDAARAKAALIAIWEEHWASLLSSGSLPIEVPRAIQDRLFALRRTQPPTPSWWHWINAKANEDAQKQTTLAYRLAWMTASKSRQEIQAPEQ